MLSCVSSGGSEALVDQGLGFWTEHNTLWAENEWFAVTTLDNERAVSRVLDRYIMRQKTMLSLTVHEECFAKYEDKVVFRAVGLGLLPTPWPVEGEAAPEQYQGGDELEEKEYPEKDDCQNIDEELYEGTTIEALAASYEMEGEGQQRYWMKQRPENCCFASFRQASGPQNLCRMATHCLSCSAKHFEEKDKQDGLIPRRTAAAVSLLSKKCQWLELPTDKIFDFIYTLDQRLNGHADLKKELSYYGATRCT